MKNLASQKFGRRFDVKSLDELIKNEIPFRMLNEVAEESRIYKHLAAVAVMANIVVFTLLALYLR